VADKALPLTVFQEIILQRYMYSLMNRDSKESKRLKNMKNFPKDSNLIVPEVVYSTFADENKSVDWSNYIPDFVIYPKAPPAKKRGGCLSGDGNFLEVKMSLKHSFELHQWAALLYKGKSIVASLSKISNKEWKKLCTDKAKAIHKKDTSLKGKNWLKKPENRVEHFSIDEGDFMEWYTKNAGLMLDDQLHDKSKPRYWMCVLGNEAMNNWNRMRDATNVNNRYWAWKNKSHARDALLRIRGGDKIIFIHCQPKTTDKAKKTTRWSYNIKTGITASDKQIQKMKVVIKQIYLAEVKSASTSVRNYSSYYVKLGDGEDVTFFETCTSKNCKGQGCNGCNRGRVRSINELTWPHFLSFEELVKIDCADIITNRGTIGRRWTESGLEVRGNPPVELTWDEFVQLKAKCYAKQENLPETTEKITIEEINNVISDLETIREGLSE